MESSQDKKAFKRVLLKVSGESLRGGGTSAIDPDSLSAMADEIVDSIRFGVETAVVVGGGNIFRGSELENLGIARITGDMMGMLSTVINALALQDSLENKGIETRVMTAVKMDEVAEPMIRRRVLRHLEKDRVVLFAGGTGSPYFTTDTAAALRASEIGAEVLLKATKVDGIYSADPEKVEDAEKYESISYIDFIDKGLRVMDTTAVSFCMENKIPIIVFNLLKKGNLRRVVSGERVGSMVCGS